MPHNTNPPTDNATPILPCAHCGSSVKKTTHYSVGSLRFTASLTCTNQTCPATMTWQGNANDNRDYIHAKLAKKWNTRRAEIHAPEGWIKVEDIPQEWKDGRILWGLNKNLHNSCIWWGFDELFNDCRFCGHVFDENGNIYDASNQDITHAMLPPKAPK